MTRLLDGPGADLTFDLRLAPAYLRAVQSPLKWDALDQPDDTPAADEHVHVYRRLAGTWSQVHVRAATRAASGCWQAADYVYVPDAPVELLRDTLTWRVWTTLMPGPNGEALQPLPTGLIADLVRFPVEDVRTAAAALGAGETDDCWTLAPRELEAAKP
jgi:hypothetical protein